MSAAVVKQMPMFKKAYKKLHENQKKVVDDAIRKIIKNPKIGEEKKAILLAFLSINSKCIIKKIY